MDATGNLTEIEKLNKIANLTYFDIATLSQIYPELSINSLYSNIKRWIKKGDLIQLKKGMYVTQKYIDKTSDISTYKEFLANKIKYPSYLSLEYVLQKYSMLSESINAYTSITLKSKNIYNNDLGRYIYRNISEELFTGFEIREIGEYFIKEATKSKALFDYLYLKLYRVKSINIQNLLELRLNMEEFKENEIKEFDKYCYGTDIKKYKNLTSLIIKAYDL